MFGSALVVYRPCNGRLSYQGHKLSTLYGCRKVCLRCIKKLEAVIILEVKVMLKCNISGPLVAHWDLYRNDRIVTIMVSKHRDMKQFKRFLCEHNEPAPDGTVWMLIKGPLPTELTDVLNEELSTEKSCTQHGYTKFDLLRYI
jgi:hypothetical protein